MNFLKSTEMQTKMKQGASTPPNACGPYIVIIFLLLLMFLLRGIRVIKLFVILFCFLVVFVSLSSFHLNLSKDFDAEYLQL